jgi:membrane protein DedA with SNARE-associated domain
MLEMNSQDLVTLLATHGYWIILLIVAVESMGVPLPGETLLLLASIYAGTTHHLSVALVIVAAASGAVLGDNLGFLVGREGGYRLLHRYGRYVHLDERKLRLGRYLFQEHGGKVVFFGRFAPFLRIWAAFLAGSHRMDWRRFLLCNAAGGVVWASIMGLAGYTFGHAVLRLGGFIALACAVVATLAMGAMMIALQRNEHRLQAKADVAFESERLAA